MPLKRRHHTQLQAEITDVFSRIFVADGLSAQLVPEGCTASVRCYDPLGAGSTDYVFASETQFVAVLGKLRKDARGVLPETPEVAQLRVQAQAKSLREGGPVRLFKGGVAYDIVVTDAAGEEEVLCGRAGAHTSRLAEAVIGVSPSAHQAGQPLQLAQTEAVKKAEVRGLGKRSAAAEAALVEAAGVSTDASELINLCELRGRRPEGELLPLIQAAQTRLCEVGKGEEAEALVAARLALTMHHARPDVKGGKLGGKLGGKPHPLLDRTPRPRAFAARSRYAHARPTTYRAADPNRRRALFCGAGGCDRCGDARRPHGVHEPAQ